MALCFHNDNALEKNLYLLQNMLQKWPMDHTLNTKESRNSPFKHCIEISLKYKLYYLSTRKVSGQGQDLTALRWRTLVHALETQRQYVNSTTWSNWVQGLLSVRLTTLPPVWMVKRGHSALRSSFVKRKKTYEKCCEHLPFDVFVPRGYADDVDMPLSWEAS